MNNDSERRLLAIARVQHQVFTRQQALDAGFSRKVIDSNLHRGRWVRVLAGVYALGGSVVSWKQRMFAALLACGPTARASHRGAGAIWGWTTDLFEPDVTVDAEVKRQHSGISPYRSRHEECATKDGFRVTKPARTIIDLASCVEPDRLAMVVDEAHRQRLIHPDRLMTVLDQDAHKRRAGTAVLRDIVALRCGSQPLMSKLESRFFGVLRSCGLPIPERQRPVQTRRGRRFVDFAYGDRMLAIETDGWAWHGTREDFERDSARRNELEVLGWHVLSVTWRMLETDALDVAFTIGRGLGMRPCKWA